MPTDYEKELLRHRDLDRKSAAGDLQAKKEKAKVGETLRAMEREANRSGTVLQPSWQGDGVVVKKKEGPSKRVLQEAALLKYDDEKPVEIAERAGEEPRVTTLRQHHRKRLFGGK